MHTGELIETARALVFECSKEHPQLVEIQRLCNTSFIEIQNPPGVIRSLFKDTDEESGEPAKATFTALHWLTDHSSGCSVSVPEDQINIFALDTDKCEIHCLVKVLKGLHDIQLRKDTRFMTLLKDQYSKFRTRFAEEMSEEGCSCSGGQ